MQTGKTRLLAVAGKARSSLFPDVPTFAESGYPDIRGDSWIGMLAPAGTPKEIIEKLHGAISSTLTRPDVWEKLTRQGLEIMNLDPAAFDALIKDELEVFAQLAKDKTTRNLPRPVMAHDPFVDFIGFKEVEAQQLEYLPNPHSSRPAAA